MSKRKHDTLVKIEQIYFKLVNRQLMYAKRVNFVKKLVVINYKKWGQK